MALSFTASIDRSIQRVQQEVNDLVYKISIELFLAVVKRTPSPVNKGYHATGLLVNQWYPTFGTGYSSELTSATSGDGAASRARITGLRGSGFLGQDGSLTLSNNVPHAYRAEMLGWYSKDGWSGKSGSDGAGGPYRMVALSLQEIAAKYNE